MKQFSQLASRILLTIYALLVISGILLGLFVLIRNIIHEMSK